MEELFGEAVVVKRRILRAGSQRVHAEEVFIVDGLLRCLGPMKISTFGLRINFKDNPEEGRSSERQDRCWIRCRWQRIAVGGGPGEDFYVRT